MSRFLAFVPIGLAIAAAPNAHAVTPTPAKTHVESPKGSAKGPDCVPLLSMRERKAQAALGESRSGEGERDLFSKWFYGPRRYPAGAIPPNARGNAIHQAKTKNKPAGTRSALVIPLTWAPLGPDRIPGGQTDEGTFTPDYAAGTVSGRVSAIAAHPSDANTIYVGGAQGGVWKTTNATDPSPIWTPLTDSEVSLANGDIAIDPTNPQIIYVGTGEAANSCDSYYGAGVLRSLDGGATWAQFGGAVGGAFYGHSISKVIVDPVSAGSATTTTVYVSTSRAFTGSTTGVCDFGPVFIPPDGAAANAGVYKSTDSGQTWTRLDVPVDNGSAPAETNPIHDMVLDPNDPDTLFVAARTYPTPERGGLWVSHNIQDASPTFTKVGGGFPNAGASYPLIRRIRLTALGNGNGNNSTLMAAIQGIDERLWGLYRSDDSGASWYHVDDGKHGYGTVNNNHLTRKNGPYFSSSLVGRRIVIGNVISGTVTRVVNKNVLHYSLYQGAAIKPSAPFGPWSIGAYPTYCDGQCSYDMTVELDPGDTAAKTVYAGGNVHSFRSDTSGSPGGHTLWRSTDAGKHWRAISQGEGDDTGIHTDDHDMAFGADGALYNGNDGGVWRSTDGGETWTNLNTNIAITQFTSVALHPTDKDQVLGGTQDNGTNIRNNALVPVNGWFHTDYGDGGVALIDQSSPSTMYHTYYNISFGFYGPGRSDNGGVDGPLSWAFVGNYFGYGPACYNGMDPTDDVSFYAPMAQNTTFDPNAIYFGSDKVYRSEDPQPTIVQIGPSFFCSGNESWTPVSPVLTKSGRYSGHYVTAISPLTTAGGPEVVYAGTSDGRIAVTADVAGAPPVWSAIDSAPIPNRSVAQIVVDPSDSTGNTAYAAMQGFDANGGAPGHVFRTTNGLSATPTWTNISGDLPDTPTNCILVVPGSSPLAGLYVGTDIGVFRTTDGVNWTWLQDGLPNVAVHALDYRFYPTTTAANGRQPLGVPTPPGDHSIVAATHGRGMFRLLNTVP